MALEIISFVWAIARGAAAVLLNLLPRRHWGALSVFPIESTVVATAVLTTLLGALLGISGFLDYAARASDAVAEATLVIATRQAASRTPGGAEVTTVAPQAISALSLPAFFLFTPLGWVSTYLACSGLVRVAAYHADDPVGDPVLTAIDTLMRRLSAAFRGRRAGQARSRLEGPEVPDALFTGAWAGRAEVDYVLVTSRRKPEWTPGTVVVTAERWYTIGEAFDLCLSGRLRTGYPLTEQRVPEVLRRGVSYELPPLRRGPPPDREAPPHRRAP